MYRFQVPFPFLLAAFLLLGDVDAFNVFGAKPKSSTKLPLPMFDQESQRWIPSPNDDREYPYDAVGALLRHGPVTFINRVVNKDEYEQGVLKYMAVARVSRAEATGNMDAKLNNAADWAYQKLAEKNGAPKVDYTVLDQKQAILTTMWAAFITPLTIKVVYETFSQF
mmetsp:Transcript_11971/g.23002  ORF Transcript_11971/g.23002 Transcript_11971/m.23002 type:complete len:167 (-) Transcript_11971:42-542(-)